MILVFRDKIHIHDILENKRVHNNLKFNIKNYI